MRKPCAVSGARCAQRAVATARRCSPQPFQRWRRSLPAVLRSSIGTSHCRALGQVNA